MNLGVAHLSVAGGVDVACLRGDAVGGSILKGKFLITCNKDRKDRRMKMQRPSMRCLQV